MSLGSGYKESLIKLTFTIRFRFTHLK
jgi:hypothetical protein